MSPTHGIKKYNMNNERRGIALVINIRTFDLTLEPENQAKERVWSIKDVENLRQSFEYLEFEFVRCENLKAKEIISTIQGLAKYVDHTKSDCFLCVVMSHGNQDKILASDNKEISFEEIMEPIKSCTSLINKPKLFFFQSCRGNKEMTFAPRPSSASSMQNNKRPKLDPIQIDSALTDAQPFDGISISKVEFESDLFVFYSTLPNHSSFALDNQGTYFIKSVCEVFKEAYKNLPNNLSLSQMATKINEKVKEEGVRLGKRMQLSDPRTSLTKELYFRPKNVSGFFSLKKVLVILTLEIRWSTGN
jgi:hypothetical protein